MGLLKSERGFGGGGGGVAVGVFGGGGGASMRLWCLGGGFIEGITVRLLCTGTLEFSLAVLKSFLTWNLLTLNA